MRDFDGIERSQKKLFRNIQNELDLIDHGSSKEIKAYERAFHASLPRRHQVTTKKELLKTLARGHVILVGDFHPFRQSQKGFLRLLKESRKKAAIGLECIQQAHQAAVDEYLAKLITLEELREKIEFERYWPFSWNSYREILEYAKHTHAKVIALNIPERKRNAAMLRQRDKAAAERISAALLSDPELSIYVLYGELHLAKKHLPGDLASLLSKQKTIITVHQNLPTLYWKVSKQVNTHKSEVLKLGTHEFCLLNSVPWVKLRSYLDWLEGNPEGEDWEREGVDLNGSIQQYAELLRETLKLRAEPRADLDVFGPDQLTKPRLPKLHTHEKVIFRHATDFHRTGYLAGSAILLLPVTSTNALSESASLLLWRSQLSRSQRAISPYGEPLIVQFFIGYLGSKILNPKRKCNEVGDLRAFIASTKGKKTEASKRRIYKRSLLLLQAMEKAKKIPSQKLRATEEVEASRLAAYILADRLFIALLRDPSLIDFIRRIFTASAASPSWAKHLLDEIASCLKSHWVEPKRKSEKF
jgi:hypothetical protein